MPNPLIQAIIQGAPVQVGLEGAPIRIEMKAPQGPAGAAGPNTVTSATTTNFTAGNVLSSNGTTVTSLSRSGIDTRTSFPNDDVTNATTTGTPDQLLRLNAGGNAVANIFIATEGVEVGEEGGDSGYLRIVNISGNGAVIDNANDANASVASLPTGSGTLALVAQTDGSIASTDISDFTSAVEAAAPNSVTSATTSDGTANLDVATLNANADTDEYGVYAVSQNQTAVYGYSYIANGVFGESDSGIGLYASTNTGDHVAMFADSVQQLSAIERVRGWFVWFYNTFTGRLKTADITDDRDWTLPDRSGNIALTEDYTAGTATIDVLSATVQGTLTASHIHGNIAGSVYTHIRAGEDLAKGDPVYVSGFHSGTGRPIVNKADASNAAKMPAIGVMDAAVSNNNNGHMVITGTIEDLNTNAYAVNTVLYVASGGGWTSTPPAANSQAVGIVERSNTNTGAVIIKVNGLASSGGNGASDANKLARFSSAGTLPIGNIGGLGSNVATFLATPTSANLAAAVTDETGNGSLVLNTLPTITSPTLAGTPNFTATSYTFAADARIGFLNNLSSQFVYKNGTIPYAEIFEDFPITGGTHGFITASGTTAYYTGGSSSSTRYWGAISMTTGSVTDNTATITLAPSGGANGQTTSRIELSHQICFCVNNATSTEFRARFQGGGQTFDCAVLFSTGVLQLEAANIGGTGINTVSVATGLSLAAGDFISGTRYRLFVRCVTATETEVYLASAPWNSSTWTTLVDTIKTHSAPTVAFVSTQPVYFVTTKTNASRIAYVDWVAIRYALQR